MIEQAATEPSSNFAIWIPIVAGVVLALVAFVWLTMNKRVDKVEDKVQGHEIELARGEEKFNAVQSKLEEIHTDVREVKRNCPKCPG